MLKLYPSDWEERSEDFKTKRVIESKALLEGKTPKPIKVDAEIPPKVIFIDGVRRTELRVSVFDSNRFLGEGIFISIGAGALEVRKNGDRFEYELLKTYAVRLFIHNTDREFKEVEIKTDSQNLVFKPLRSPIGEISVFANRVMKKLETRLLKEVNDQKTPIIADGPVKLFNFYPNVAYIVKESRYFYVSGWEDLLFNLKRGERTPLFLYEEPLERITQEGIKEIKAQKVGSYIKLWEGRFLGNPLGAIARIEFPYGGNPQRLKEAVSWASAVALHFANDPLRDKRSPQNLTAIAFLEKELRRKLGEYSFIRRKLEGAISA